MSVLSTQKNLGKEKKLFEFTHGIDVDCYLFQQEIQVQKSWARALAEIQVLTQDEAKQAQSVLDEACELMSSGRFQWRIEDEDIHMNLERFMVEKLGEVGKRVHFGRSRNDLIATSLRLFVRDSLHEIQIETSQLILGLMDQSEAFMGAIVPGMTHLQHGQPIRFGHMLAAHGWAFSRDLTRLKFAQNQAMAVMPLGSAALSGTNLEVNLETLAAELGFVSPPQNSYDSVGDRDFLLEGLNSISLLGVHLSRIAEDFVIWSSTPVSLVQLPPNWSTGSSIMPNKRNPDVPELIRAKAAHLIACSTNAHLLLKGLPSSYQSDLHELKRVFIRAHSEVIPSLQVLTRFVREIRLNLTRAKELIHQGHLLATEVANQLTLQGVPFREAYRQTAALVETAESQGVSIENLSKEVFQKISPILSELSASEFSFEAAVEGRRLSGGTSLRSALEGVGKLKMFVKHHIPEGKK